MQILENIKWASTTRESMTGNDCTNIAAINAVLLWQVQWHRGMEEDKKKQVPTFKFWAVGKSFMG